MTAPILTEKMWLNVLPLLQDAIDKMGGTHDLADIVRDLLDGKLQVWAGEQSFVLTEINQYPKARELLVVLMGGDMDEIMTLEPVITAFADEKGCDWVSAFGRMGFQRKSVWSDAGWKPHRVEYRKELNHG
jgi:hypothetical protein